MSRENYTFADLQPDVVEEVRLTERKLSEKCGEPITLIAYRSDAPALQRATQVKQTGRWMRNSD